VAELGLLCVHPHPDDESIACGGVIARYLDEGIRCHVVTCTGGEAGSNLAGIDLGGEDIPTHRRRELANALEELGGPGHDMLGYRDSGMAGTPPNAHPDAFANAELDEAAGRLAAIIRRERPDVVVSDDTNGTYGHPDHVMGNRVTVRAVALAADPSAGVEGAPHTVTKRYVHAISRQRMRASHGSLLEAGVASPWGSDPDLAIEDLPFGVDESLVTTVVDVSRWLDRKRAAMAAHRTQIGPSSFFLNTPREDVANHFGIEEFVLEDGPEPDGIEDDLFAGLRP
jgi:N-acetyl-1-D-myo-inositol-2-amino-2-deoxy-alpha-D-glucopyranoside deacetylase